MKEFVESGHLYLVPTPIGNMSDITERSINVLQNVDFVAAEDTRNGGKLLALLGFKKPFVTYQKHNAKKACETIIPRLKNGESCAVITDAGTPAVSDPGEEIVAECAKNEIPVVPLPGCCAAVCALSASGLDCRRFAFEGFLPENAGERKEYLNETARDRHTLIFYIPPHDVQRDLKDIYDAFGERDCALCRELTKINEEIIRQPLSVLCKCEFTQKGEMVLVVSGAKINESWANLSVREHFDGYVKAGMSPKEAIKAVAADRNTAKSEIYSAVMIKGKEE